MSLGYGGRDAVARLSGAFAPGSFTAVVGPNGAGKTTLLRALADLHPPSAGRIDRGALVRADIALLPQAARPDPRFPLTCRDVAAQGLFPRLGPFRAASAAQQAAIDAALMAVGLGGAGATPVGALSAGQFQRLLFARLAVQDAPVLLLDEPFNAVDAPTVVVLLSLLAAWHREGRTIVAVLHDIDLVQRLFPETLVLAGAPVGWGPTAEVLTPANRRRAGLDAPDWSLLDGIASFAPARSRSAA